MPPSTRLCSVAPSVAHSVHSKAESDARESSSSDARSGRSGLMKFAARARKSVTKLVSGAVPPQQQSKTLPRQTPAADPRSPVRVQPVLPFAVGPPVVYDVGDADDDSEAARQCEEDFSSDHTHVTVELEDQFAIEENCDKHFPRTRFRRRAPRDPLAVQV